MRHRPPTEAMFQSTHPRGVRHATKMPVLKQRTVSIHAPAWGATSKLGYNVSLRSFNPRTRVGCDRKNGRMERGSLCFNPRTRVGCDLFFKNE